MKWISPRIWRSAKSNFNEDEPLNCAGIYTPEVLADIHTQGFDAIWMRGRLWELIRSQIYPELNDPKANQRIDNLKKTIAAGKKTGVDVFLYFNEPLALPREHNFWERHPKLVGEPYCEPELGWDALSFCTSTSQFKEFFNESISNLFDDLIGLGGVILITASEYQSHCWSHRARRKIEDPYLDRCLVNLECPNCKDREPADVVGELIGIWKTQADSRNPAPEVWAWNWSWSIWYEPPQHEIIDKLPEGVKLMCDFERGGMRNQGIGRIAIDEYSLGYTGPSEQFIGALKAARNRNIPVCAKLQIGTTHELATVPNLPLIPNLFDKLRKADELGIEGLMCSWNFGNTATLNTAAMRLFVNRSDLRKNKSKFLHALAKEYFGAEDCKKVIETWESFCRAFAEYPFSIKMLYHSPMNYAVAYSLKLKYEDRPMGPSWIPHSPWGNRLEDCFGPFTIDEIIKSYRSMSDLWQQGLADYCEVLSPSLVISEKHLRHRSEELSCARMIGCHIRCILGAFRFHRWRLGVIAVKGLQPPCHVPLNDQALEIIQRQIADAKEALQLSEADARLGFHQEPQFRFYDLERIQIAIDIMSREIEGSRL